MDDSANSSEAHSSINLDVVISTTDHSVDMKTGLDTLQGISDATRKISETIIEGKIPKRLHHGSKIRTRLKRTFKGSYGQTFSLEIRGELQRKKLRRIGKSTFVELIMYFINESMYEVGSEISRKAKDLIDGMGPVADDLTQQIRSSCLPDIHEISSKFGPDVSLNYRKSAHQREEIGRFTQETAEVLQAIQSEESVDIVASITRLNINTGNGRFRPLDSI